MPTKLVPQDAFGRLGLELVKAIRGNDLVNFVCGHWPLFSSQDFSSDLVNCFLHGETYVVDDEEG